MPLCGVEARVGFAYAGRNVLVMVLVESGCEEKLGMPRPKIKMVGAMGRARHRYRFLGTIVAMDDKWRAERWRVDHMILLCDFLTCLDRFHYRDQGRPTLGDNHKMAVEKASRQRRAGVHKVRASCFRAEG